jgi:membrane protein
MSETFKNKILSFPLVISTMSFLNRIVLPGFDGLPILEVLRFFIRGLQKSDLITRASSLAFFFFIAIFPGIIFMFTLIAYIPIDNFQETLMAVLKGIMPDNAYQMTNSTLIDIISRRKGGLLSVGFFMAAFFSTSGILAMIDAFNNSYHITDTRGFVMKRIMAIALTIVLTLLLLFSIAMMIFGEMIVAQLTEMDLLNNSIEYYALLFGKWLLLLCLCYFSISILYYYGPAKRDHWKFFSAGSSIATLLTVIISIGFAYFINNFGQYNKLYGSIGTIIVILLWLYINSFILLIGFELNASIRNAKFNTIKE